MQQFLYRRNFSAHLGKQLEEELLNHTVSLTLALKMLRSCLPKWLSRVHSHQPCGRPSTAPRPQQRLVSSVFRTSHSNWYVVVLHVLTGISLMTYDMSTFYKLFIFYISSLVRCLLRCWTHVLIGLTVFLLLSFEFLVYFGNKSFITHVFYKHFF